jgi:gamma-glutamylcyclotransferase (GGCT)/AIG2-like uncharacterized protein YtfP
MIESLPELDTDFLFVCGTLRRGCVLHHHLRRMGAEFVASGNVQGELFDLGRGWCLRNGGLLCLSF